MFSGTGSALARTKKSSKELTGTGFASAGSCVKIGSGIVIDQMGGPL